MSFSSSSLQHTACAKDLLRSLKDIPARSGVVDSCMLAMEQGFPFSSLLPLAGMAGDVIMLHYSGDAGELHIDIKADDSPVTSADRASHDLIAQGLSELFQDIPVLSEEGEMPSDEVRGEWDEYFLVDPLDGTKGFLRRTDHFTVNIALMQRGDDGVVVPVAGVIYVPVQEKWYWGGKGFGSYTLAVSKGVAVPISISKAGGEEPVVLQSDVSKTPRLNNWLGEMPHKRLRAGSSLKFCLLAEGKAQLFPCLHPTWEWDTAAGQAIVEGAGGTVTTLEGEPFVYSKNPPLNGYFLAQA